MAKAPRKARAPMSVETSCAEESSARLPQDGRVRAVIDAVFPSIDAGRFPVKHVAGVPFVVTASCFTDSHDKIRVQMRWSRCDSRESYVEEMRAEPNDVWTAQFTPPVPGRYRYTVVAWVDHFDSWRQELNRREDNADVAMALKIGEQLLTERAGRAQGADGAALQEWARSMGVKAESKLGGISELKALGLDPARSAIASRYPDTSLTTEVSREMVADRKRAEFSSWYELFPRSSAPEPQRHGTFRDVHAHLPRLKTMGFDVLYFPPIHPIGRTNRKGKNNSLTASALDVGSPWAIGAAEGGHKQIHPDLGNLEDFRALVSAARTEGIEIAMDIAFQCAPDHPYVAEHPSWFKKRPDGSVQYAENPPKKYQDIYPFDFESEDWRALWTELKNVVSFWVDQGVEIFRVDNPHTKSFAFWEWLIGDIKAKNPDVLFLAEAFTRPKIMQRLAKLGFSQSYTYFTWRNTKHELTEYFRELTEGPTRDFYRPNVWPNTPDILPETLQSGLRQVFAMRLILATTLAASYGIYGPAFEGMESAPREAGSEEYLDSEKYQLRHWSLQRTDSIRSLIERMNKIRRENAALQSDKSLQFCHADNEQIIAYLKMDAESGNTVLTVVNLDPHQAQSAWVTLDIAKLDLHEDQTFQVHDLLSEQRYLWRGARNYVRLDPQRTPAHIFVLRHRVRSEHDFDYYL